MSTNSGMPWRLDLLVHVGVELVVEEQVVGEARAAAADHAHPQCLRIEPFGLLNFSDLVRCTFGETESSTVSPNG